MREKYDGSLRADALFFRGVGKTCLVNSYVKSEFPNQQVPTA